MHGVVVRFLRDPRDHLVRVQEHDECRVGARPGEPGEDPVVRAAAPPEPHPARVDREAGQQHDVRTGHGVRAEALAAGVSVSLSSDAPVLAPDWREGAAAADAWMGPAAAGTEEKRMLELLRAYTVAPAKQDGADAWKGTLEPKKVADLVVLAENPLSVPPAELPRVAIDMTVVDGDVVFERAAALVG